MPSYVIAVDQGTTSTRAILFDQKGAVIASESQEFEQFYPSPGWTEHDPDEIISTVVHCLKAVASKVPRDEIKAIGVTNQRETTLAWDKVTGKYLHRAIVWLDTRTSETVKKMCDGESKDSVKSIDRFRAKTGLPISTYFSALKIKWMIDNVPEVKKAVGEERCNFGTIDSWIMYNITKEKVFVTDVSNASRYLLLNINSLKWDEEVCAEFRIPLQTLPEVKSCAEHYGYLNEEVFPDLGGISVCGSLGDQHASLLGQGCLEVGSVKNTYGTGCFMLTNTGPTSIRSIHGLLSTVGYKLGPDAPCIYALEGSVSIAGRLLVWLMESMKLISSFEEMETCAAECESSEGCVVVPAFQGLFAPYWRPDARAGIMGMTLRTQKSHICRASLESVAFQNVDIIRAMEKDMGEPITTLCVDGGMTKNETMMQIQADTAQFTLQRARMCEATALGAAFAAGLSAKVWTDIRDIKKLIEENGGYEPIAPVKDKAWSEEVYARWLDAVPRTYNLSSL